MFFGPTRVSATYSISIGSAAFAQYIRVTNRQTDTHTHTQTDTQTTLRATSAAIDRILCTERMRCGL